MLLSVIVHIYNNQKALEDQAAMWKTWDLGNKVELVFIDDCSSPQLDLSSLPLATKCYRILDDIPWNMPGAKNLGALKASGEWLLFYDTDQFLDSEGLKKLVEQLPVLPARTIFRFNRFDLKDHKPLPIHQNCQVIRKKEYLDLGGYDEDFSGAYGHDDSYFERLWTFYGGKISVLKEPYIFDDDRLATQNLDRDKKRNRLLRRKKMRHLHIESYTQGKALLKSTFIFNFLIKCQFIANGRPQSNIRFKWEEIKR